MPNVTREPIGNLRFNLTLHGEPCDWVSNWRERGLVSSARDVLIQALRALHKEIVEQDLKTIQLASAKEGGSDE